MSSMLQDFRYALRQMRRSPGFSVVAVLTLALGIGANTAIFSIVDATVLHPLPFPRASGIVTLWWTDSSPGGLNGIAAVTDPGSVEWQKQSSLLEQIAFYRGHTSNLTGVGDPVRLSGAEVSPGLFPLLETRPWLGRTFLAEEQKPGQSQVVLLSHKLWQSRFAAKRAILNQPIKLDGQLFTVVGVMPEGFDFPNETEFWTPFVPSDDESNATLKMIGRLKPGVSLERASAEAAVITKRLDEQNHRNEDFAVRTSLIPLETAVGSESRASMFTLLGAVGLLLLIGCTNVANLLLARGASRGQEIAIRNALGATSARIIRQLITESGLLASVGGILGLSIAMAGRPILAAAVAALPRSLASPSAASRLASASMNPTILLFTFTVSLLTGILFGLTPALQGAGTSSSSALKSGSRNLVGSLGKGRLREILVVTEIALACVLLASAGVLVRSFITLIEVNPGFESRDVLSMNLELPESRYQSPEQMISFEQRALEKLQSIPGVISTGSVFGLPLGDVQIHGDFAVENEPAPPPGVAPAKIVVGGDYFRAIGIPLLAGRMFNARDSQTAPPVVIVSQTLARRFWPNEDAVGRRLKLGFSHDPWCTVVGVVGDVRQFDLQDESALALYMPYAQAPSPFLMRALTFVVRYGSGDPSGTAAAARHAITAVDPDMPLFDIASMDQLVHRSLSEPRFNTFLFGLFAGLALLLAALGAYGVMSCAVAARTNEIGVRLALGANPRDVLLQVLQRVTLLALAGLGAGLLAAMIASRFLASQLYHTRPVDIATYVAVSILMMLSALLAGYIPARRAARVDPMVALRYE